MSAAKQMVRSSDRFGAEVVSIGGFAMTRTEAFKLCKMCGDDNRLADMAAFGTKAIDQPAAFTAIEAAEFMRAAGVQVAA